MGVVVGDDPGSVLPRPAGEANGDAGRHAEEPQHERHGAGEVLQ
jgi:hypothetical protein